MQFYNNNQIAKMQIRNTSIKYNYTKTKYPEEKIIEVISPFLPQIEGKKLNVFIMRKNSFSLDLEADWRLYELILFNIV